MNQDFYNDFYVNLDKIDGERLKRILTTIQSGEGDVSDLTRAIELFGDAHYWESVPEMKRLLSHDHFQVRYSALEVLTLNFRLPELWEVTHTFLEHDPDTSCRMIGASCLGVLKRNTADQRTLEILACVVANASEKRIVREVAYEAMKDVIDYSQHHASSSPLDLAKDVNWQLVHRYCKQEEVSSKQTDEAGSHEMLLDHEKPFWFLSSDEITQQDLAGLLERCGAKMYYQKGCLGEISYRASQIQIDLEDLKTQNINIIQRAEKVIKAPIRSSIKFVAISDDREAGYQLLYDFAYLCIQHYDGVLANVMYSIDYRAPLDDDFQHPDLDTKEFLTVAYQSRWFAKLVPPLVEKPEEEAN
ncbi:hypothetical protein [Tengunoibacter tsumagoiensis]|uniref:HEAT repeat domain-containing protein n=1 Tax=Tengunoibacter tsumagoiensis TaxID=2014871 RepID=A0A401ZUX2_9CHLR|nr:hypothetical protein [Tengunoibacter tsumagoiensis]GCE10530.1 hypothetical protein KTT_03890 [Tengunoibacter tsumagoiensis]